MTAYIVMALRALCYICYLKWARSALRDLWNEVWSRIADKA